jgi:hypothetical protein
MDDIGNALAIALEEMDEFSGEERYSDPGIAARIRSVRTAMEDLQLLLDQRVN